MAFRRFISWFIVSLVLIVTGCSEGKVSEMLDRAETLQDDHADSALAILDSIAISDCDGNAQRARYALLKTYVKANLHLLTPADTNLINIAVDYYIKNKLADGAAKACFYKGDIIYDAGDYDSAMRYALRSLEWNEKANDLRFRAKAYELIGYIYSHARNYPQAISYSRKAAAIFKTIGRRNNEFYSILSAARSYSQDDTTERKAVELLDSIKENFKDVDSTALGMLHYRYIYPLSLLGHHQEGYRHYRKALAYWNGIDMLESKPLVADMFTNIGMYDSAAYYLRQERMVNPGYDNDVNYHFALRNLADSLRDIPLYYKEVMTFSELERRNVRTAMRDEISLIERDFEHDRAEREHIRNERIALVSIFTVALIILAGAFAFLFLRQRHRNNIELMRSRMALVNNELDRLQENIGNLEDTTIEFPLRTIDLFCDEYYRSNAAKDKDAAEKYEEAVKSFHRALGRMRDKEFTGRIQTALDRRHNGIFSVLNSLEDKPNDIDLVMLTYIIAGLSLQSVALICGMNDKNLYNRWYRLKNKLQKRYPERKEELERILNRTPTGRAKPAR